MMLGTAFLTMKKIPIKALLLFSCISFSSIVFIPGSEANNAHTKEFDRDTASELLKQATQFFNEANSESLSREEALSLYQKAALRYERLINRYDITNGKLFYNLGNTYFMMGDTGRAIFNYLMAEQYIPHDPNLEQNLKYVREKQIDKIGKKQQEVSKSLFSRRYNLSLKARVMLFSLFLTLSWGTAVFRIFFKKPFLSWCMTVSVFVTVSMAGLFVLDELSLKKNRPGVVISPETTARKGNSEAYEPTFTGPIHAGAEFILLEDRGSWFYIKLADSRTCWIKARDAALL